MFEKVNPMHPDKIADRIAGAIVDLAYKKNSNPKIAVEVLIGHGECNIIIESSETFDFKSIDSIVKRISNTKDVKLNLVTVPQDSNLSKNQDGEIRCGDNGIFKGTPTTLEQKYLSELARNIYNNYPTDGKYIYDSVTNKLIVCQSKFDDKFIFPEGTIINPLGNWDGGINVDCGATNRKLGSDMGDSVTGGGLHGKDLSKADVSVNIYAHLLAQRIGTPVELFCAIGDTKINNVDYTHIVEVAKDYINSIGGFEKFAEWGLI